MNCSKAFTLIELIVVIAIIAVLSGIILFSVTQYISKGKDSNIAGNLVVLIPAGEVYYNVNSNSYKGFCDPTQSSGSVFKNAISQMPQNKNGYCYGGNQNDPTTWTSASNPAGICCYINSDGNSWAACAREFTSPADVYCVDSRGMKEYISNSNCTSIANAFRCP
jgi:prepilin-type N-terminal cleavage/methylation domain-containing protein